MSNGLLHRLSCRCRLAIVVAGLSGCMATEDKPVRHGGDAAANTPLIQHLAIQPIRVEATTLEPAALNTVRDGYASLVDQLDDETLIRQLSLRLADVEMLLAETELVEGQQQSPAEMGFQRAESAYQKVLSQYGDDNGRADILYQLSRVYDLQGKRKQSAALLAQLLVEQPDTVHATEAWFRQGEAFYNEGEYLLAAQAYEQVLAAQQYDTFYAMAAYMQGWAYYKLEAYDRSLVAFDTLLSVSFSSNNQRGVDPESALPNVTALPKGQQKLVKDSLRVMADVLSVQGNGNAAIAFYQQYGDKPHSYLVFNELAQQHLDNDRYSDAADAYLAFASTHVGHSEAVAFFVKHIDVYILGGFASKVMAAKASFINTFGLNKGQYLLLSRRNQERVNPYLHQYLSELAQAQHSLAQQLSNPQRRNTLPETLQGLSEQAFGEQANSAFHRAAEYYLEFIATFPEDPARPQMQFHLAESYYQAEQYAKAITHYEAFAYRYPDHPRAADGAYTALLSYKKLLAASPDENNNALLSDQRTSRDRFVEGFISDPRVVSVVQSLMQQQFDNRRYRDALFYSGWLLRPPTDMRHPISPALQRAAQRVTAHSYFGLQDYAQAETAYGSILSGLSKDHQDYAALSRNYALSVYKQAEYAASRNQLNDAVAHLKRIIINAPDVDVRVNAQYDAATYLLTLEQFIDAQAMFEDFATRFPHHALTDVIPSKLLFIFEQTQQWQRAADIVHQRWLEEGNTEQGREALLLAAEYYEKAGNRQASLPAYRTYAHTFPEPFDTATEVRHMMSEFYLQSGEDSKRRFWLNKLIHGHDNAGENGTARSRTLAAKAAMVFADDARYAFEAIKLKQPLKSSLQQKRLALTNAVNAHNKVLNYGVREYATRANHKLGGLFNTLAAHLMASDRPNNLSDLEREQYDLLLEEQAYPFEEQAISVLENNARRSWGGVYDEWVKASFEQLQQLLPMRYQKQEQVEANRFEHY